MCCARRSPRQCPRVWQYRRLTGSLDLMTHVAMIDLVAGGSVDLGQPWCVWIALRPGDFVGMGSAKWPSRRHEAFFIFH